MSDGAFFLVGFWHFIRLKEISSGIISVVATYAEMVGKGLARAHFLDVLLQPASPRARHFVSQAMHLDVHAHVVVVARLVLLQELPLLHGAVVAADRAELRPLVLVRAALWWLVPGSGQLHE